METVLENSVSRFESITNYKISEYLISFTIFVDIDYPKIVNFYLGKAMVNIDSFNNLASLQEQNTKVFDLINLYKNSFDSYNDWILLDILEEIKTKLVTITNISKILRSSLVNSAYKGQPQLDYGIKQNQTLEQVSKNVLSSTDENSDWLDIAISNNLKEEDYTPKGGVPIKISYKNNRSIFVESVVDNINQDTIYGKDINKKIEFIDEDLNTTTGFETFVQSVNILINLNKNGNPQYPSDGKDRRLIIGQSTASLAFPSFLRQIQATFQKDDTIKQITITNIEQVKDGVYFEYDIESIIGEVKSFNMMF